MATWGSSINAFIKVYYDKSKEYIEYYTNWSTDPESEEEKNSEILISDEDNLGDYDSVLDVEKYTDEKSNKRIKPEVGFYTEHSWFFSPPTHIIDNIYLGSAYNAATKDILDDNEIAVIFNITKEIRNYHPEDFTYYRCYLSDDNKDSIAEHLEDVYKKIVWHQQNTEGNILIHCYMGRSRSASVVIYYLMKKMKKDTGESFTFDDAMDYILEKRPIVNPTFRFTKDLAKSMIKD